MRKKKVNRRNAAKFPALEPKLNLKTRTDLIDYDYLHKLNDKEKAWLNSFTDEYIGANMKHKGRKLHKTKKSQRECYKMNNDRNACVYTRAKAQGKTMNLMDIVGKEDFKDNPMDDWIDRIDSLKEMEQFVKSGDDSGDDTEDT